MHTNMQNLSLCIFCLSSNYQAVGHCVELTFLAGKLWLGSKHNKETKAVLIDIVSAFRHSLNALNSNTRLKNLIRILVLIRILIVPICPSKKGIYTHAKQHMEMWTFNIIDIFINVLALFLHSLQLYCKRTVNKNDREL